MIPIRYRRFRDRVLRLDNNKPTSRWKRTRFQFKIRLIFKTVFATIVCFMIHETDEEAVGQDANYDESKIPAYSLPDPLTFNSGEKVVSPEQWSKRRSEILKHFREHVYGVMPETLPKNKRFKYVISKEEEIDLEIDPRQKEAGVVKARLVEIILYLDREDENEKRNKLNLLMFFPADKKGQVPLFVGYNFQGNNTVHKSSHISLPDCVWNRGKGEPADEKQRGAKSGRWSVGLLVSKGYGLATAYYGDVDPDFDDGFENGFHALHPELQNRPDNWTSIGAWAWGLSRMMDVFETFTKVDSTRVAVVGHSRLGKTSLWAGATDERFRVVISNNSGCGGAAIARREIGETVKRINTVFPHWFCERHKEYNDSVDQLPVDQHMLVALMAPRPVYIASAEEDRWADPKGEFLAAYHASPVYRLLGLKGLGIDQPVMPFVNNPIGETVGYHIRPGKHDLKRYDWEQFIEFAHKHFDTDPKPTENQ